MSIDRSIAQHYAHGDLERAILDALIAMGKDPDRLAIEDLAPVDEFHIGGRAATAEFFEKLGLKSGMHVLDIGSGLGGPARFAAQALGCQVTGIDLTPEYVEVANALARRVGLDKRVSYVCGSAVDLPFPDASFDAAYMLHVGMNIEDKAKLMGEVRRVLKPGAAFGIYDVMRTGDGDLAFPVPWARSTEDQLRRAAGRLSPAAGLRWHSTSCMNATAAGTRSSSSTPCAPASLRRARRRWESISSWAATSRTRPAICSPIWSAG